MLFNSTVYFLFLTLVVLVYWRLKWRQQNYFLLAASYFFYGWWDWRFLMLMIGSTIIDFLIARKLKSTGDPLARRSLLIASLIVNFSILGFFKYFNFFVDSTASALGFFGFHVPLTVLRIILPPGISFYTFQEVAYIVDVYHGKLEPAKSFVDYALFISLFPHLIAGPIQRPSHLLPQTQKPRSFNGEAFVHGVFLIMSGLFRKVVIADNCAILANAAFDGRMGHNTLAVLIGVYAFAWQIYGDFSAYTDFARGSAQLLGFHFMLNFRQPYLAQSLQDFWRRWHISLSTWLRDYLYIPLGGNRKGEVRTYVNLMTTMLLGGLWHGANWTFVVWGGIHGAGLAVERFFVGRIREHGPASTAVVWMKRMAVFHVVCLSWIFFRAVNLREALAYVAALGHFVWDSAYINAALFLACMSLPLLLMDFRLENYEEEYVFEKTPEGARLAVATAALVLVFVFAASQSNQFIYFQF